MSKFNTVKIRKAVFPVAGMGTRFLPATKASPKEMMPIVDTPLIQFAVEEAIAARITELIFVTSSSKRSIEDHFDSHFELETKLASRDQTALLNIVKNVLPKGVTCVYVRQPEALGLGHAILCAKSVIGEEPFAVLLADDLIDSHGPRNCLEEMVLRYQETQSNIIAVEKIAKTQSEKYGIIGFSQPLQQFGQISKIVEKPKPEFAPSEFAVIGRYILNPIILDELEKIDPGKSGEIQLTDAIANSLTREATFALQFSGIRYDCGSKLGYLQAIVNYGLRHPEVGAQFQQYLNTLNIHLNSSGIQTVLNTAET